jgi:hypothetical protein
VDENPSKEEYIPFLTVVSNDFEKDLPLVKNTLVASEKMTRAKNGFKLSERAEMAAGWCGFMIFLSPVTFCKSCFNNFSSRGRS